MNLVLGQISRPISIVQSKGVCRLSTQRMQRHRKAAQNIRGGASAGGSIPEPAGQAPDDSEKYELQEDLPENIYAPLHDFCMGLPYGMIMVLCGIVGLVRGIVWGMPVAAVGVGVLCFSSVSLTNWKKRDLSNFSTKMSALASGFLLYRMYTYYQQQYALGIAAIVISALTVALSLFMVVNVVMGGNRPKDIEYVEEGEEAEEGEEGLGEGKGGSESQDTPKDKGAE